MPHSPEHPTGKDVSAMTEFLEWLKTRYHPSKYELVDKATSLLAKERQQIIDAYDEGQVIMTKLVCEELELDVSGMPKEKDDAINYFNNHYKQV